MDGEQVSMLRSNRNELRQIETPGEVVEELQELPEAKCMLWKTLGKDGVQGSSQVQVAEKGGCPGSRGRCDVSAPTVLCVTLSMRFRVSGERVPGWVWTSCPLLPQGLP